MSELTPEERYGLTQSKWDSSTPHERYKLAFDRMIERYKAKFGRGWLRNEEAAKAFNQESQSLHRGIFGEE